jgi:carbon monoxide dehydrogenase subunit G
VPRQTFTAAALASATRKEVWAALDQPETWAGIGGVQRVFDPIVDDSARLLGFGFETIAAGKRYIGQATPAQRVDAETMAWHIENSEIRGTITVDLTDEGEDTRVAVTLDVESKGMLTSMFFPVIAGAIGSGLPEQVERFAVGLGNAGT